MFDPNYFIVATDRDWRVKGSASGCFGATTVWNAMGIRFRTRAGISGLLLVDLQIGNTDWVEAKECEEAGNSSDDGVRDEGDDEESGNDGSEWRQRRYGGENCCFDIWSTASATSYRVLHKGLCTVRYRRHGFDPQDRAPSNIKRADEFACRLQSDSSCTGLSVEDCVSQACKYHPLRTQQTSRLHPNLFLLSPS